MKKKFIDLPPDNPAVGDLLVGSKAGTKSYKFTIQQFCDLLVTLGGLLPSGGTTGQVLKAGPVWGNDLAQPVDKTLAYNLNGTLQSITTPLGVMTFSYNPDGTLAQIVGTGEYKTKTFTYSGGKLVQITVN